jgi:hypothetical protein
MRTLLRLTRKVGDEGVGVVDPLSQQLCNATIASQHHDQSTRTIAH